MSDAIQNGNAMAGRPHGVRARLRSARTWVADRARRTARWIRAYDEVAELDDRDLRDLGITRERARYVIAHGLGRHDA